MKSWTKNDGFSLIELVLLTGIVGLIMSLAVINFENSRREAKEEQLKKNLKELRIALHQYYQDHGHYPCTEKDYNRKGDFKILKKQLLWYTNKFGEPKRTRNREYRFGPYLREFPAEPFSGQFTVVIDTARALTLIELKREIAHSPAAKGGWFYQAKTGFVVANLSSVYFKEYYAYF